MLIIGEIVLGTLIISSFRETFNLFVGLKIFLFSFISVFGIWLLKERNNLL